jgi:hypothetical protein
MPDLPSAEVVEAARAYLAAPNLATKQALYKAIEATVPGRAATPFWATAWALANYAALAALDPEPPARAPEGEG